MQPQFQGSQVAQRSSRSSINRVERACNECKRMKIRCKGGERPPCENCRTHGAECDFERSKMSRSSQERLCRMELHITEIRAILATILEKISDLSQNHGEISPSASLPYLPPRHVQTLPQCATHDIPFATMDLLESKPENHPLGPRWQSSPYTLWIPTESRSLTNDRVTQSLPQPLPHHQESSDEFSKPEPAALWKVSSDAAPATW